MTTREEILAILHDVRYPGIDRSIVDLDYVKAIEPDGEGWHIRMELRTSRIEAARAIEAQARERLDRAGVRYTLDTSDAGAAAAPAPASAAPAPTPPLLEDLVPGVRHKLAVASGKGGVGKSTVAVNLALALADRGRRVGLLDADVYGPSLPTMLGVAAAHLDSHDGKLVPVPAHGVRAISLGFLMQGLDPIIWRGPLASRAIEQLLRDVEWGELDELVIDMPPGTGDIQISIAQKANIAGAVIVSTPQDVALIDAIRAVHMFRKVDIPVIGWIENMSRFECPHCGRESRIFASGSLAHELERLEVPQLGSIPIDPAIASGGDGGEPIVRAAPAGAAAAAYRQLAVQVLESLESRDRRSGATGRS
jgi:ATP-binding protein involved in chromosome partitioning